MRYRRGDLWSTGHPGNPLTNHLRKGVSFDASSSMLPSMKRTLLPWMCLPLSVLASGFLEFSEPAPGSFHVEGKEIPLTLRASLPDGAITAAERETLRREMLDLVAVASEAAAILGKVKP